ncbi:hypothetical protein RYX36_019135 [Vicia faba]
MDGLQTLVHKEIINTFEIAKLACQILHDDFAQVLRDHNYEVLELCGVNRMVRMLLILDIEDSKRTELAYE